MPVTLSSCRLVRRIRAVRVLASASLVQRDRSRHSRAGAPSRSSMRVLRASAMLRYVN